MNGIGTNTDPTEWNSDDWDTFFARPDVQETLRTVSIDSAKEAARRRAENAIAPEYWRMPIGPTGTRLHI